MELTLFQSLILGLISGFAEVLPVSAEAHRRLMLIFFGISETPAFLRLMIHLSTVLALHFICRGHIVRMMRAQRLSRIPKRRRKRPLDTEALMDFNLLKTTLIPIVLAFLAYSKVRTFFTGLVFTAAFLALNGLILYIPQFLPGANKESGSMSRLDGVILGLGGAVSTLPGVSCVGSAVSIASVRGMDLKQALNLALVLNIPVNLGFAAYDVLDLLSGGMRSFSFTLLVGSILAALAVVLGMILGLKLLKKLVESQGYAIFSFYSWGAALFAFVFFLMFA